MTREHREMPSLWQRFKDEGWFNATGLPVYESVYGISSVLGIILPHPELFTGFGMNNHMSAAYLPDGTVWMRSGFAQPPEFEGMNNLLNAHVPASTQEFSLDFRHIMERLADPFWCGGPARRWSDDGLSMILLGYFERPAILEELRLHPDFIRREEKMQRAQAQERSAD